MNQEQLFSLSLRLVPSWLVDYFSSTVGDKQPDLQITFPAGSRFACN